MLNSILALYFSGTGNTAFVVKQVCKKFTDNGIKCTIISIEDYMNNMEVFNNADTILIAHPIYGSDMPWIMKEFINKNSMLLKNKQIITIITQMIFSGDGGNLAARLLKRQNIRHIASLHINMPSNISDRAIFRIKNGFENSKKIIKAKSKINKSVDKIIKGHNIKNGRYLCSWFLGFFGQRMFYQLYYEKKLKKSLKINKNLCIKCGKCINLCPNKAISLFTKKKPMVQYQGIEIS